MTRDDIIGQVWGLWHIDQLKSVLSLDMQGRLDAVPVWWQHEHIEVSKWWADMETMRGAAIDMAREECP